jgi:hypothetical protein
MFTVEYYTIILPLCLERRVLPLEMVDNSISLCERISGWFSPHLTVQVELCWLLWTSVQKIGIVRAIEQASLPKHVSCEYHQ